MKLTEISAVAESCVAPLSLSGQFCKKYGAYDNSGVILDCGEDIRGALFCLDLTQAAAGETVKRGYNLIFTHHPAIFGGIKSVSCSPASPTAALAQCMRAGISVVSMHLNFDAAPFGIDWHLMRGLGGKCEESVMCPLEGGGYGRLYDVEGQPFADFCAHVKEEFASRRCVFYDSGRQVKKVASFCGAGCDEQSVAFAIAGGADTFVSSDFKHHHIAALVNAGINIVSLTHYASEIYGFARIYASLKERLSIPSALFIEKIFL